MKSCIFCQSPAFYERFDTTPEKIREVLNRVAADTDTNDLVVCVYLFARGKRWGGNCQSQRWSSPENIKKSRFHQKMAGMPIPGDLPVRFKTIRIYFGGGLPAYPTSAISRYRFEFRFRSFEDHVAHLFAHELHHFRRYHLGLHPGEGESSAERWAHRHITSLGFKSEFKKRPRRQPKRYRRRALPSDVVNAHEKLRHVTVGCQLIFKNSGSREARIKNGEILTVLRPPRRGSFRMPVRTADGRPFLVPLTMLEIKN